MKRCIAVILAGALCALPSYAASKKEREAAEEQARLQTQLDSLRHQVEALKKIKAEKLDRIEQLETARWEERYRENRLLQEHQEKVRALEDRYSRSTGDLSRMQDELVQMRNTTEDLKTKASDAKQSLTELATQVMQMADKLSSDQSNDFPVGLETRVLSLARAKEAVSAASPQISKAVDDVFDALRARYALTLDQEFISRNSQLGDRPDVPVYRLRTGTVFLAEMAREGDAVQALQRTGALQGRVFEWRVDLSQSFGDAVRMALQQAHKGEASLWLPVDVLQNKSVQSTTRKSQERNWKQRAKEFFRSGGPVMYPLALVAIFALLLSLERWLTFVRRGRISRRFLKTFNDHVEHMRFEEALALAQAQKTSLGNTLAAIIANVRTGSRSAAEKALREVMLREQPLLERRMGLVGALGSSAPLLGLLGTVTGMISLFKVITDVGTNDAKVLAGGIAEALITTETGLAIAIPVLLLHGWLTERLDVILSNLGIQAMSLLNRLWPEADRK
ncbi:MAG TPA: MotA/TolQ/ExbB proton channel family protein [Fibrobacteraceae bacterium]|nr:MotA/TolQ/ExbB proton channel family protein [Fibrobacteraceae bacterium]